MDSVDANSMMDSQSAPACGAALLLVIGEPHSDEHKSLILAEVTKGESHCFHFYTEIRFHFYTEIQAELNW